MKLPINMKHSPKEQFDFKNYNHLKLESFDLYRDNRFTKIMINNRHDLPMSKHNNAGYGFQIFYKNKNVGSVWLLNQITTNTTYVRVSRYESYHPGFFIAVLSELSDFFRK